jgi:adenine C2-methylase RlmN of 23S rRNA A2503 and tRNA A37
MIALNDWSVLPSKEDASVNFSVDTADGGMLECRYVRREKGHFIVYVSSHTGCRHACRFCHLTQSGQTMMREATVAEILSQVRRVLAHYDTLGDPANRVNINFMARGEPMSSAVVTGRFKEIAEPVMGEATRRGLQINFNLSTIMPADSAGVDLVQSFQGWPVRIYWSLYSLDEGFRRRWLPKAQAPDAVAARLKDWQTRTGSALILHWALIAGENDDEATLNGIVYFVKQHQLEARFNLVRYNSFGPRTGEEAGDNAIARAMQIMTAAMTKDGSRIVSRVGRDVKASCGMFL